MQEGKIIVNTDSLRNVSEKIEQTNLNIIDKLDKISDEFVRLDECFDSTTGKKFKEEILKYISNSKEKIDKESKTITEKLTSSANTYDRLYSDISVLVSK